MAEPLAGQTAVVTGASSGLGRATALALGRRGATVALLGRTAADLDAVARNLEERGSGGLPLVCDLADAEATADAFAAVKHGLGPVAVLVNAAGTDAPGPVVDLEVADWDRVLAVNLRAAFLLSRLVVPDMIYAGRGTIVNVSSVAGKRGWANASAYCASKFALTGFTQALGAEVRPYGVRACCIYPGAMATNWGAWSSAERSSQSGTRSSPKALSAASIADFIAWVVTAPPELVLDEVVVTPLDEQGYP